MACDSAAFTEVPRESKSVSPAAEDHAACGAGRHCEGCGNACDCGSVRLGRRRVATASTSSSGIPRPARSTSGYRYYVVAELPQSFDGRLGKVLISEEAGQRLGLLILLDLTVDLVEVIGDKRPGVDQVGRSECGEYAEDLGFSQTEPPVVLQRPDRDSCSRDPRITTTYPSRSSPIPEPRPAKSCSTVASIIVIPPRHYSSAPATRRNLASRVQGKIGHRTYRTSRPASSPTETGQPWKLFVCIQQSGPTIKWDDRSGPGVPCAG